MKRIKDLKSEHKRLSGKDYGLDGNTEYLRKTSKTILKKNVGKNRITLFEL